MSKKNIGEIVGWMGLLLTLSAFFFPKDKAYLVAGIGLTGMVSGSVMFQSGKD